jgi:uncharacterized protein YceH (UPF0502 family)
LAVWSEETTTPILPVDADALYSACNQKSSRYPVFPIRRARWLGLATLREKGLTTEITSSEASRVARYRHLFLERVQINQREAAVLC